MIGAIVTFGIAGSITDGIRDALCTLTGGQCAKVDPSAGAMAAAELVAREQALVGLVAGGASYGQLLAEARAARERGDLDLANRLLDRLELYGRLIAATRGDLVDGLVSTYRRRS